MDWRELLYEPQFYWMWQSFILMTGLCVGSFINVCIWRLPRNETVVTTPSHCPVCNARLHWYENIPLLSWLCLRGKCGHCATAIPARYLLVESLTGLFIWGAFQKVITFYWVVPEVFPLEVMLIASAVAVAVIDWKHRLIPNEITYTLLFFGLIWSGIFPEVQRMFIFDNQDHLNWFESAGRSAFAASAAGLGLWSFKTVGEAWLKRDIFGWGDIKYCAAIGACTGITGVIFAVAAGGLFGTLFGVYLSGIRALKGRRRRFGWGVPFGPFLALGVLTWIACGDYLLIALAEQLQFFYQWLLDFKNQGVDG